MIDAYIADVNVFHFRNKLNIKTPLIELTYIKTKIKF